MTSQQIRETVARYIQNNGSQIDPIFRQLVEMEIMDECYARRITSQEADELFALIGEAA